MTATSSSTPVIDVCVATYKRPESLTKLLGTLVAQETAGRFSIAIHVADNDKLRSAEALVRDFPSNGIEISYDVELVQNISLARNKSMERARGEYIATIDDDCYADPRWLLTLYEAAVAYGADAVYGRVVPVLHPETPRYLKAYYRRKVLPTGSTDGFVVATANSLFRRQLIEGQKEPFDPRFGRSGGEDRVFFNRLQARGCRMIWCHEAVVFGPVARERATLRWILRRRFRLGNTWARVHGIEPGLSSIFKMASGLVRLSVFAAGYSVFGIVHRGFREKAADRLFSALNLSARLAGHLADRCGLHFEEYKEK